MRYLGGHLGIAVTALLDGQLDVSSTERAWQHVQACAACRRQVELEGWVKTRLASISGEDPPPSQLLGSLYRLDGATAREESSAAAWAAVREIERRGRGRRRAGLAVAGAGSVSLAVLGLATLTGSQLGIGGAEVARPDVPSASLTGGVSPSTLSRSTVVAPVTHVHGTFRLPAEPGGRQGGHGSDAFHR